MRRRVLLCYADPPSSYQSYGAATLAYVRRLQAAGFDVEPFCLTLEPPAPCLTWSQLDAAWRRGDRRLLAMYARLEERLAAGREVLLNECGINLHPEFVAGLPVFTAFQCFDDPENSSELSRPVAAAYDLALVGNPAEVATYRAWGVRHAVWQPLGFRADQVEAGLSDAQVVAEPRDLPVAMLADRTSPWRRERLDRFAAAFPDGVFQGRGWPAGLLPIGGEAGLLRRCRIGPNIHNSTGPVNSRTYTVPACGAMLLCDNPGELAAIYRPGVEAVGFSSIEEAIELGRYYLAHEDERRAIALAGWKRAWSDYREDAVFARMLRQVEACEAPLRPVSGSAGILVRQAERTRLRRAVHALSAPLRFALRTLGRVGRRLGRVFR